MRATLALLLLAVSASFGCSELSRFSTGAGESYCGVVTGASFVRSDGLAPGARMRLVLDVDGLESQPGQLWTDELAKGEQLWATPMRAVNQVSADTLSTLTFGEGSVKSTLAIAELGHTEVLVVISMMQTGDVDVRLLRGDGQPTYADGTPKPPQIFGVFKLTKTAGDCGLK